MANLGMANFVSIHTPHAASMLTLKDTHTHRYTDILFYFMERDNKINIVATLISSLLLSLNASVELLLKTPFQKRGHQLEGKILFCY